MVFTCVYSWLVCLPYSPVKCQPSWSASSPWTDSSFYSSPSPSITSDVALASWPASLCGSWVWFSLVFLSCLLPSLQTGISLVRLAFVYLCRSPEFHFLDKGKYSDRRGLCYAVWWSKMSATAGGLHLPDRQPNSGSWLRFWFESPRGWLVVSLFEDHINYGHLTHWNHIKCALLGLRA